MTAYALYRSKMQAIARWQQTAAVLHWDMEVNLPVSAVQGRAGQIAMIHGMVQELQASDELFHLLEELDSSGGLTEEQAANVRVSLKDIRRKRKYTRAFVERLSMQSSMALDAWNTARKSGDSAGFLAVLSDLVALKKEEAALTGFSEHPYDALLDEYEPGMTAGQLDRYFDGLIPELRVILQRHTRGDGPDPLPDPGISRDELWACGLELLRLIGFDFSRGRQDLSAHPFTINLGSDDIRVTTRIPEDKPSDMIWSCLHEGGHALYEQGLSGIDDGLPVAGAASLGIHESQSRLWENHVGRSLEFWQGALPLLRKKFDRLFGQLDPGTLYRSINRISPGFLRTQADEVTYHLHVLIRYEIEKALLAGHLQTADIPAEWNRLYLLHLDLKVPSDNLGFLQDIHWAHGSFGYFPTYSLGSLYAAQFFNAACKSDPGLPGQMGRLDFTSLQQWLAQHVFRHGRTLVSEEICTRATGEPLNPAYFIRYVTNKLASEPSP